jgi:ferric iron reductase protein FhuF
MSKYVIWLSDENGVTASKVRDGEVEKFIRDIKTNDHFKKVIDVVESIDYENLNLNQKGAINSLNYMKALIKDGLIQAENIHWNNEGKVKYFELCYTEKGGKQ